MTVDNKEVSLLQRVLWVGNTIFHALVVLASVFIFSVFFYNFETDVKRLWHIFLSTCAIIPLMAEGIILMFDSNVWSQRLDIVKKAYIHGILLGISTITVTVGIIFETVSKDEQGEVHFQSDHAITGLISWILAMVSILLGLFATYSQALKHIIKPVYFKILHNFVGIACYAFGITSLSLGLYIWGFASFVSNHQQQATLGIVGIIAIWSVLGAFRSLYYQMKAIVT